MAAAQANDAVEKGNSPTTPAFAQLRVLQPNIREPMVFSCARGFVPEAEMSRDMVNKIIHKRSKLVKAQRKPLWLYGVIRDMARASRSSDDIVD